MDSSIFELHSFGKPETPMPDGSPADLAFGGLPWLEDTGLHRSVLQIAGTQPPSASVTWIATDEVSGSPGVVEHQHAAVAGFSVLQRRAGPGLAMFAPSRQNRVLVNGIPALEFTILSPRDCLVISPGIYTYVTERIRPYAGQPPAEMIGMKCPFCKIPFTADTCLVTCRCGVAYHRETEQSHPNIDPKDRLNCLDRLQVCLSCSRPVSLEESVVWDPQSL